jgi:hypothetical protein
MSRSCTRCGLLKTVECFSTMGTGRRRSSCKPCTAELARIDRIQNPERHRAANKRWNERHPEKRRALHHRWRSKNLDKDRATCRAWGRANRQRRNEKKRLRMVSDVNFKLAERLRIRIWDAVKGDQKSGSAVSDLGCTIPELKAHLESKFQPGMTWDNWGKTGWHIDHIKPLSKFDLADRQQFLQACHYTNLQPLWAEENLMKGAT